MPTAAYAVRVLSFQFGLGQGNYGAGGSTQIVHTGNRATVHVEFANAPTTGTATMSIFGMPLSDMNQLSVAGLVFGARQGNTVIVQAGDALSGMSTVFSGIIIEAFPDFRSQPEVSFYVFATPSAVTQLKPVQPTSFTGATDGATALGQIAAKAGLTVENNGGVSTQLASPYFAGTAWNQILGCTRAMGCFAHLDGVNGILAIWPKDGSRGGGTTTISPATGMIGYPSFEYTQVKLRTLFSPSLNLSVGKLIHVQSQLQAANGPFSITGLTFDLSSQMPDGPWEIGIVGTPQGQ